MMSIDHRQLAQARVDTLIDRLKAQPGNTRTLIEECEALSRAIAAFHMEGIRFRMYNVDRLLHKNDSDFPADAAALFAEARRELEAAGFHTRSHQAPG
jgi:hypothetical protein